MSDHVHLNVIKIYDLADVHGENNHAVGYRRLPKML